MTDETRNIGVIELELKWFSEVLDYRFNDYFSGDHTEELPTAPLVIEDDTPYGKMLLDNEFDDAHRLLLMLVLVPHVPRKPLGHPAARLRR